MGSRLKCFDKKTVARVKEMAKAGMEFKEISAKLAADGILGVRSGKPLSSSSISQLVKKKTRASRSVPTAEPANTSTAEKKKIHAVKTILGMDMEAEERIALVQLMLE